MEATIKNKLAVLTAVVVGLGGIGYAAFPENHFVLRGMSSAHAKEGVRIPAPSSAIKEPSGTQTAIFAGGCFWGIEGVYEKVAGVISAESGYSGGSEGGAQYDLVSAGYTKHAESVRIRYDPTKVSYNELMHIFFSVAHDPTQLNRQGPDRGEQYRSAIFPANDAQRNAAKAYIAQLNKAGAWGDPIVTTIEGFGFFAAEEYHQDYMSKHPNQPYIQAWDMPKVANLGLLFPENLK